jgi:hypothetical protein
LHKLKFQIFLLGTFWQVHWMRKLPLRSFTLHIPTPDPPANLDPSVCQIISPAWRVMGQVGNQYLCRGIWTLKGVPLAVLGFILSWPICNVWMWACPMSDPLPNHIPIPLSLQAEAIASASTTKWRGGSLRRTSTAAVGPCLQSQYCLHMLASAGNQGLPWPWVR